MLATPGKAAPGHADGSFADDLAGAGDEEVDRQSDHAHRRDCKADRRHERRRHHEGMGVWIESHGRREIELTLWSRNAGVSSPFRASQATPSAKPEMRFSSYRNMTPQEVRCPHCKKPFAGELLAEDSRHEGF